MEGPPLQPQPSHLKPAEEELPPPPEEPAGFPEREASTGMTERSLCGPLGPLWGQHGLVGAAGGTGTSSQCNNGPYRCEAILFLPP